MTITMGELFKYCRDEALEIKYAFDIGTQDGRDAIVFQHHLPNTIIFALEGNPDTYSKHSGRFKENLSGINYINLVIADENAHSVPFHKKTPTECDPLRDGISGLRDRGSKYAGETCLVKTSRFDTFCEQNNIPQADLVKIDVEGCTYEVLKGFGKMLSTVQVFHLETEQTQLFEGQVTEDEVFDFLISSGFHMVRRRHCVITQYDSIWRKNK